MEGKFPSQPHFSSLEEGRGGGAGRVTACYRGGSPGCRTFCPHLSLRPSSLTPILVQAAIISLAGASSPVSRLFLPSPLAIHPTASRKFHLTLESDHVSSLLQTFSDSLLTRSHHQGTRATGSALFSSPPLHSFCSRHTILLAAPGSHHACSHLKAFALAVPSAGNALPPITTWPTPLSPSSLCSNLTAQGSHAAPSLSSQSLLTGSAAGSRARITV